MGEQATLLTRSHTGRAHSVASSIDTDMMFSLVAHTFKAPWRYEVEAERVAVEPGGHSEQVFEQGVSLESCLHATSVPEDVTCGVHQFRMVR